jgi:opacity protein-like surface antigen
VLPGQAGSRLDGRHDDAQDIDRPTDLLAIAGQPGLLQATKRDGRGGVAGQDHDAGPAIEQALAAGPGEIDDLLAGPHAVGRMSLVGQVGEVRLRQTLHEGAVDREPAHAGVEDADHEASCSRQTLCRPRGRHRVERLRSCHVTGPDRCHRVAANLHRRHSVQRRTFLASAAAAGAAAISPSLAMAQASNPLTAKWTGPYGGIPAFDKVKVADFKPALEAAMAKNLAEIDAITGNKAAPTFDNTIAALEDAGRMLNDVQTYYNIWGSNMSSPEFQVVEGEMDPKLSAHNDKVNQNVALFARIEAVYNSPDKAKLSPSSSACCGSTTPTSCGRRQAGPGGQGPDRRDQHRAGRPLHQVQPEPAGRREHLYRADRRRPGRPAGLAEGQRRLQRGRSASSGQVHHRQHPLQRGPVPDLFAGARHPREGLEAPSSIAATTAARPTTTPSSPRS